MARYSHICTVFFATPGITSDLLCITLDPSVYEFMIPVSLCDIIDVYESGYFLMVNDLGGKHFSAA